MHVHHRALILLTALPAITHASPDNPIDQDRGYTAIPLGPFFEEDTYPTGLNNLGEAAGYSQTPNPFSRRAWNWADDFAGVPASPPGRPSSRIWDINDIGIRVGTTQESFTGSPLFGGWWDETGLHSDNTGNWTEALAIADDPLSRMAGFDQRNGVIEPRVFIFGVPLPLTMPPGLVAGAAFDINNDGAIAGWVENPDGPGLRACWWPDAATVELAPIADPYSRSLGINGVGDVVGEVRRGDGSSIAQSVGFFWTPGVGFRELDPPAGQVWSSAEAVALNKVAIGTTGVSASPAAFARGAIWDNSSAHLLDDLTPARNDLEIGRAVAINHAGEIVAHARRPDGPDYETLGVLLYPRNGRIEYNPVLPLTQLDSGPRAITHGDFDDDGNQDIAVTTDASNIQIFLGAGDGTLTPSTGVFTAAPPTDLDTADFNNDGIPDLLVATENGVGVAIGDGVGRFAPATADYFFANTATRRAKALDINGDQFPDAVATRSLNGDIQFYRGTASGRLIPEFTRPTEPDPLEIAIADFNGDGFDDAAVTTTAGVSVVRSGPGGTYATDPTALNGFANQSAIAAADINNDGRTDLITIASFAVVLIVNRNDTEFHDERITFELGFNFVNNPQGLALTDMDLDGDPDIIAAFRDTDATISTGYNRGSGYPIDSFEITPFPEFSDPREIATPDMNNDGTPDLVAVDNEFGRLIVILNNATPPGDLPPGCNEADLAGNFGILDLADINAFVSGFISQNPIADLNGDTLFDLADIGIFVSAFLAGCP